MAVILKRWLSNLSNDNAQGEYYLTDIIAACHGEGKTIATGTSQKLRLKWKAQIIEFSWRI